MQTEPGLPTDGDLTGSVKGWQVLGTVCMAEMFNMLLVYARGSKYGRDGRRSIIVNSPQCPMFRRTSQDVIFTGHLSGRVLTKV